MNNHGSDPRNASQDVGLYQDPSKPRQDPSKPRKDPSKPRKDSENPDPGLAAEWNPPRGRPSLDAKQSTGNAVPGPEPASRPPTTVHTIVGAGLSIALVLLGTMIIRYPVPATGGYVNVGDAVIFVLAALFGPQLGCVAGGIGSALADLLTAPGFAPFTLVVKGVEGLVAGLLTGRRRPSSADWRLAVAFAVAAVWMVVGYQLTYRILIGNWAAAVASLPGDSIQGLSSIALGWLLTRALGSRMLGGGGRLRKRP